MRLDLFPEIIGIAELLVVDREFFILVGKLLDDKVAKRVQIYWKDCEEHLDLKATEDNYLHYILGKTYRLSKEVLEEKVKVCLFYEEVEKQDIAGILESLSPANLRYYDGDYTGLKKKLEWVLDNKIYYQSYNKERQREDWLSFLKYCTDLEREVFFLNKDSNLKSLGIHPNVDLYGRLQDNKNFFYTTHEKRRYTGLGTLLSKLSELDSMLNGVEYLEILKSNSVLISASDRRAF